MRIWMVKYACVLRIASRMNTGSSSCDGGSERHSFRERQPAELLQLGKKNNMQSSNTHCERTDTQPTGNEYERFFVLRSAVISNPTTAANALYLAPYDGWQDTEHTGTNYRVFGGSIRRTPARMKRFARHKTAGTRTKLLVFVWKAVLHRHMCKFYTADFQNSAAKRKENLLAKRSPLPTSPDCKSWTQDQTWPEQVVFNRLQLSELRESRRQSGTCKIWEQTPSQSLPDSD